MKLSALMDSQGWLVVTWIVVILLSLPFVYNSLRRELRDSRLEKEIAASESDTSEFEP
jgi:hypothetical protein